MKAGNVNTRIIVGTRCPEPLNGTPTVTAYGDPDDHLRIIALLAEKLETERRREQASACKAPTSTWSDRKLAFSELLRLSHDEPRSTPIACFLDPDALDPRSTLTASSTSRWVEEQMRWDDAAFAQQREETLEIIVSAAERGGWWLLRTMPSESTSKRLDQVKVPPELADDLSTDLGEVPESHRARLRLALLGLAPALRRLALGLLERRRIDGYSLARTIELCEPRDVASVILEMAYDTLPIEVAEAARRLSTIRAPALLSERMSPLKLEIEGVFKTLKDFGAGWLENIGDGHRTGMSWSVRQFLATRAELADPDRVLADHSQIARGCCPSVVSLDEKLEVHHHAIAAGDVEVATKTAVCYGTDLRQLALRWSLEEEFDKAADLYDRIVRDFDSTDAYAWEYLGYNLMRSDDRARRGRARSALRKACELDPRNPLFRGRLLEDRARAGEQVGAEFDQWMTRFQATDDLQAVGFFAAPVLGGLARGRQYKGRRDLVERWGHILRRNVHLRDRYGRSRWFPT